MEQTFEWAESLTKRTFSQYELNSLFLGYTSKIKKKKYQKKRHVLFEWALVNFSGPEFYFTKFW